MLKSIFTATIAAFAIAGTASAETEFQAELSYDPAASVETTYRSFQTQADNICSVDLRDAGSLGAKRKIEAACADTVVTNAMMATQDAALIALHTDEGAPIEVQVFAGRN